MPAEDYSNGVGWRRLQLGSLGSRVRADDYESGASVRATTGRVERRLLPMTTQPGSLSTSVSILTRSILALPPRSRPVWMGKEMSGRMVSLALVTLGRVVLRVRAVTGRREQRKPQTTGSAATPTPSRSNYTPIFSSREDPSAE